MTSKEQGRESSGGRGNSGHNSVFAGRRALVVGGSGGIGRAISLELAARGARLFIQGRSSAKLRSLLEEIRGKGNSAEGIALELDKSSDLRELVDSILSACVNDHAPGEEKIEPAIDILVCAFGPFVRKSFGAHRAGDWEKTALLDLALPGALASTLYPGMSARGFGRILLLGGTRTDAIHGYLSNAAYAAAKTGLGVVAKSIAMEGAARNVAALVACPGLVETEYLEAEQKRTLSGAAPDGRLIQPSVVAALALDLLDCDPCPASGAIVSLDSGFSPCGFDNPSARR
jgi:NAD(P)-dependent dehydrogenase (short-subunit alcohol dehydrogenase family)